MPAPRRIDPAAGRSEEGHRRPLRCRHPGPIATQIVGMRPPGGQEDTRRRLASTCPSRRRPSGLWSGLPDLRPSAPSADNPAGPIGLLCAVECAHGSPQPGPGLSADGADGRRWKRTRGHRRPEPRHGSAIEENPPRRVGRAERGPRDPPLDAGGPRSARPTLRPSDVHSGIFAPSNAPMTGRRGGDCPQMAQIKENARSSATRAASWPGQRAESVA